MRPLTPSPTVRTSKIALQQLLATTLDAETGQRGFIITGEAAYREPHDRARNAVKSDIERPCAAVTTANNTRKLTRCDIIGEKMAELSEALQQRQQGGFAAAEAVVATNIGRQTMDRLRAVVGGMNAREDAFRCADRAADASYRAARVTSLVVTGWRSIAVTALSLARCATAPHECRRPPAEEQQAQLHEALRQKDDLWLVSHELPTDQYHRRMGAHARAQDDSRRSGRQGHWRDRAQCDLLRQLIDDLMDTNQLVSGRMRLTIDARQRGRCGEDAIDAVRLSDNKR